MLAAAQSVLVCLHDWVSAAVFVVEVSVERSDVGREGGSIRREAVVGSCWEVALVSHRIDPAVEDVAFLEELLGSRERRLGQLPDVEGHPAVVPKIDQTVLPDVVTAVAVGLAGLDAWKSGR